MTSAPIEFSVSLRDYLDTLSGEVEQLSDLTEPLEALLCNIVGSSLSVSQDRSAAQNIDLLVQSLTAIKDLLDQAARNIPEGYTITISASTRQVPFEKMRLRLGIEDVLDSGGKSGSEKLWSSGGDINFF